MKGQPMSKSKYKGVERRAFPRVKAGFPVKFAAEESGIMAHAEDISYSGVYCVVNKFIPLYTKVFLALFVPLFKGKDRVEERMDCEGVIVRAEAIQPEEKEPVYRVAIFFSEIHQKDKQKIARYVEERLEESQNNQGG